MSDERTDYLRGESVSCLIGEVYQVSDGWSVSNV